MFSFLKKLFLRGEESVISKKDDIIFMGSNDDFDFEDYKDFNTKIEREWKLNEKGIEYERVGDIDKAIVCYEENLKGGTESSHPYQRLAIIYRKRKDYKNEIRVLEQAIRMYPRQPQYNMNTYEKFKIRLDKAKLLRDRNR